MNVSLMRSSYIHCKTHSSSIYLLLLQLECRIIEIVKITHSVYAHWRLFKIRKIRWRLEGISFGIAKKQKFQEIVFSVLTYYPFCDPLKRSFIKKKWCYWCINAYLCLRYMPVNYVNLQNNKQSLYYFIATVNIKRKVKAKMINNVLISSLSFSHLFFSRCFYGSFDSSFETIIASISAYAYWKLFVRHCV